MTILGTLLLLASGAWAGVCSNLTSTCQTTGKVVQSYSGTVQVAVSSASSTTAVASMDGVTGFRSSVGTLIITSSSATVVGDVDASTYTGHNYQLSDCSAYNVGTDTFTLVAAKNVTLGCIQTSEANTGTAAALITANEYCFDTFGAKLPSWAELKISFDNYVLNNETDDAEWTDEIAWDGANHCGYTIDNDASPTYGCQTLTATYAYRCWIPR